MTLTTERTRALYDRWTPTFLACAGTTHQTVLLHSAGHEPRATNLELGRRAGLRPGMRVLDAGCGVCGPAIDLAQALPGLLIEAVTLSAVQVAAARELIQAAGLAARIMVTQADFQELPMPAGQFDAACLFESACYAGDPPRLLAELARVLRPGGVVFIKDLFRVDGALSAAQAKDLAALRELWAMPSLHTLAMWCGWAQEAGFCAIDAEVLSDAGAQWYAGTMFTLDDKGLRLNAFGAEFFRPMADAPIEWATLRMVLGARP